MMASPKCRSAIVAALLFVIIFMALHFSGSGSKYTSERASGLLMRYRQRSSTKIPARRAMPGPISSLSENPSGLVILNLTVSVSDNFKRATLRTQRGETPIFVYDISIDKWVSGAIINSGAWERGTLDLWQTLLSNVPTATAVDIGANLGQYGLAALVMGHRAVFVEPVLRNARRIAKSIQAGSPEFQQNGIVVQNALSDTRRKILFRSFKGNVGGTQILNESLQKNADTSFGSAKTILLDDLVGVVPGNDVIMKVDAECNEKQVFGVSDRFFKHYRVHTIIMEWHSCSSDTDQTSAFLTSMKERGFQPYRLSAPPKIRLKPEAARKGWPGDIMWVNERLGVLVPKSS